MLHPSSTSNQKYSTASRNAEVSCSFCLDHLGHTVDLDARPFRIGSSRDGREDEDEDDEEEEYVHDEEEPFEEYPIVNQFAKIKDQ